MKTSGRRPWNRTKTATQGNKQEQTQQSYQSNLTLLPPPEGLDEVRTEIWHEVLWSAPAETLTASDIHTLEAYVDVIYQRRAISALIDKQRLQKPKKKKKGDDVDALVDGSGGLIVKRNGTLHPNPLITMYRALLRDQSSYASTLRLTGRKVRVNDSEAERASRIVESPIKSAREGLLGGAAARGQQSNDEN